MKMIQAAIHPVLGDSHAAIPHDVTARPFSIMLAKANWELAGYQRLRREIFCVEQHLFSISDQDEHDPAAIPIVAAGTDPDGVQTVVGTVRIHESAPGTWYGSRLAVAAPWRGVAGLSAGLIRMAVCTAHGLGCEKFLANVQRQNAPLFRRLHWKTIGTTQVCGLPHHLMQAELDYYPPRAPA
jgi:putative N-acetyltransferase (TIGR04045 family)